MIARASKAAGIVARNSLRFQGQQEDEETGLHYNRHRYYDPGSGRFVSKDPIGLAGGINVYQYVPNPIVWIDPLGLSAACCCKGSYSGAKQASQYLKGAGVPRARRKEIMESFEVETIKMRNAGATNTVFATMTRAKRTPRGDICSRPFLQTASLWQSSPSGMT